MSYNQKAEANRRFAHQDDEALIPSPLNTHNKPARPRLADFVGGLQTSTRNYPLSPPPPVHHRVRHRRTAEVTDIDMSTPPTNILDLGASVSLSDASTQTFETNHASPPGSSWMTSPATTYDSSVWENDSASSSNRIPRAKPDSSIPSIFPSIWEAASVEKEESPNKVRKYEDKGDWETIGGSQSSLHAGVERPISEVPPLPSEVGFVETPVKSYKGSARARRLQTAPSPEETFRAGHMSKGPALDPALNTPSVPASQRASEHSASGHDAASRRLRAPAITGPVYGQGIPQGWYEMDSLERCIQPPRTLRRTHVHGNGTTSPLRQSPRTIGSISRTSTMHTTRSRFGSYEQLFPGSTDWVSTRQTRHYARHHPGVELDMLEQRRGKKAAWIAFFITAPFFPASVCYAAGVVDHFVVRHTGTEHSRASELQRALAMYNCIGQLLLCLGIVA